MHYIIGFGIALFIALTGVGAGTITVPVLILFLGVPAQVAVGVGLTFAAAVKLLLLPVQVAKRNVHWKTVGWLLLGGLPGVIVGSLLLKHLISLNAQSWINTALGAILATTAAWQLYFSLRKGERKRGDGSKTKLLSLLMLPVGAEVGFSSAGAGALGSAALLSLTALEPAQVVGTDIAFGFFVSLVGSGLHVFSLPLHDPLLLEMTIGGLIGAISGTLLSARVPKRALRLVLWAWLLILGGQMIVNSFTVKPAPKEQHAALVRK